MNVDSRLDRLTALRRQSPPRPDAVPNPARRGIEELVSGSVLGTSLGSHVVADWRSARVPAPLLQPTALTRLVGDFPAEVLDSKQWLFLDTETTGLAGGTGTWAFLVGVAWWEEDALAVRQLFMRDPREEPSLLMGLREIMDRRRVLVTFNGKSFDWPLLETRFRMARLGGIPAPVAHIDLLHPSRQLWRLRLGSTSLSEIERHVLGITREADIPSESIPQRYFDYLRGGSAEPLADVFGHNRMDLVGLGALAVFVHDLLRQPETGSDDACVLFGLSRIVHRRGETALAARLYEAALRSGLPPEAALVARRELALSAKRGREFGLASSLWEELRESSREDIRSCEELAIHYEHRDRDPARAAAATREAIGRLREAAVSGRIAADRFRRLHERLQHRLARVTAKLQPS